MTARLSGALGYRPCLDGLRGFAILAVIAFHAGVPFLQGGFVGVDVFFVLSGFLITCLLVQEWDRNGAISLKNFYRRRALRLLPALALLICTYLLVSCLLLPASTAAENGIDALIALFYSSNWARAFEVMRPDGFYRPDLLGHTWSLSIEEQYYLLWPLLLLAMLRTLRSRRTILWLILGGVLLSWLARALMCAEGVPFERLYNGLDTRADALLMGSLLGVAWSSGLISETGFSAAARKATSAVSILGLVVLCMAARWDRPWMYYLSFFLIALFAGAITLDLLSRREGVLNRIMEWRPLVWVGRISYGLYLWHYPIFRLVQLEDWPWYVGLPVGVTATFVVAVVSYYFLERPLLRRKFHYRGNSPSRSEIDWQPLKGAAGG